MQVLNGPGICMAAVAEQLLLAFKRIDVLDEELRAMRLLVQYMTSLTDGRELTEVVLSLPFPDGFDNELAPEEARTVTDVQLDGSLFVEVAQVLCAIDQDVAALRVRLSNLRLAVIESTLPDERGINLFEATPGPHLFRWLEALTALTRAVADIVVAFSDIERNLMQRCEEVAPSVTAVPRIFKRENQQTVVLIQDVYRRYQEAAQLFMDGALGGGAHPPAPRPPMVTCLAFEHRWAAHVNTPSTHVGRLLPTPRGVPKYATVSVDAVAIYLTRLVPTLAHEAAHLALHADDHGQSLRWHDFGKEAEQCLLDMRFELESLFDSHTSLTRDLRNAPEAHLNEMLADFVAIFTSGPYFAHSFFYAHLAEDRFELLETVPLLVRACVQLTVIDEMLADFQPPHDGFPSQRANRLVRLQHLEGLAGLPACPILWFNPTHFLEIETVARLLIAQIGDRRFAAFLEDYIRVTSRRFRELARGALDRTEQAAPSVDARHKDDLFRLRTNQDGPTLLKLVERARRLRTKGLGLDWLQPEPCHVAIVSPRNAVRPEAIYRLLVSATSYLAATFRNRNMGDVSAQMKVRSPRGRAEELATTPFWSHKAFEWRPFHALCTAHAEQQSPDHARPTVEQGHLGDLARFWFYHASWAPSATRVSSIGLSSVAAKEGRQAKEFQKYTVFGEADVLLRKTALRSDQGEHLSGRGPDKAPRLWLAGTNIQASCFVHQRDFDVIMCDKDRPGTSSGEPVRLITQARFRREWQGGGRYGAMRLRERFSQAVRVEELLLGYSWEHVAIIWTPHDPTLDSLMRGLRAIAPCCAKADRGVQDEPIGQSVTSVLIPDNRLMNCLERLRSEGSWFQFLVDREAQGFAHTDFCQRTEQPERLPAESDARAVTVDRIPAFVSELVLVPGQAPDLAPFLSLGQRSGGRAACRPHAISGASDLAIHWEFDPTLALFTITSTIARVLGDAVSSGAIAQCKTQLLVPVT